VPVTGTRVYMPDNFAAPHCARYMISALQQHFAPLLPSLIQKLVACFQHKQHSCFLYLAATTVSIFGNSEDVACQGALRDMLGAFVQVVCGSVLSSASPAPFIPVSPYIVRPRTILAGASAAVTQCALCSGCAIHRES
jgi:hypothetical protein